MPLHQLWRCTRERICAFTSEKLTCAPVCTAVRAPPPWACVCAMGATVSAAAAAIARASLNATPPSPAHTRQAKRRGPRAALPRPVCAHGREVGVRHGLHRRGPLLVVVSEQLVEQIDRLRRDQVLVLMVDEFGPRLAHVPAEQTVKVRVELQVVPARAKVVAGRKT
eukprot:4354916-Pleurochrysis_carterae.AAC.2